jgi:type II secretory pathway pseudopilin PulG
MYSLVITIIAIALVGALAAATVYYGGPILNGYQDRARATQLISEGTQVRGAAELYRSEHNMSAQTLGELIDNKYLQNGITSTAWASVVNGYAQRTTAISDNECTLANRSLGIEGIPSCDDPKYAKRIVCCKQDRASTDQTPLPTDGATP